jgi:hypothetical protein
MPSSKTLAVVLALSSISWAVDGKSLLIGIGIGLGTYVTRNYVALPVAKATKKATKKTAKCTVHVVTLGRK